MTVRWTKPAAADLTQICDYTERHFGAAQARRVALIIYEAADSLKDSPQRGRIGRKQATREIALSGLPFVLIYQVEKEVVQIARVLHGAQQWP